MAMDGNENASVESKLTKGDKAPTPSKKSTDDISALTGETREYKAKAYVAIHSHCGLLIFRDISLSISADVVLHVVQFILLLFFICHQKCSILVASVSLCR